MSSKAFTWVEVKPHGSSDSQARRCINSRDGLLEADNAFGSVRIKGLEPAHSYDYRIISKQMLDFKPYKVTYGDSIATPWYTFSTINPAQQGATIFVTSDIHNETAKLERLLDLADYKTCNAFFYAGDMVSYISNHEAPFKAFIDPSVKRFASSIPFEVVRGNHETRGNLARSYSSYFPKENGKIYGSYRLGEVMVVMLDGGEPLGLLGTDRLQRLPHGTGRVAPAADQEQGVQDGPLPHHHLPLPPGDGQDVAGREGLVGMG